MNEVIEIAGSFSTVWLTTWFVSSVLLVAAYPSVRNLLINWHPAIAANLLLLLLSCPFLLSLTSSLLLFFPAIEEFLVSAHCHDNCQAHLPLVQVPWLAEIGIGLIITVLFVLIRRLFLNLRMTRDLENQLAPLAFTTENYRLLENDTPFVFTLGWWRNDIYLTSGLQQQCSTQDLEIICAHENAHSVRRDNIRLLIANLFLLPLPGKLSKLLYDDLHLLIESACDFRAAETYHPLDIAQTLIRIQKVSPGQCSLAGATIVAAFTGAEIEMRVKALVNGRRQTIYQHVGFQLSVLMLLLCSISLVDPLHHGIETLLALP